jgi:DNA-binding GntR family transcriptional regulator
MTGMRYRRQATGVDSLQIHRAAAPLREQVTSQLRQAIIEMRLTPGQRLIERELIEQTGVSRTTIREALRELTAEGLVVTIPQKGAVVAGVTAKEAVELYEVRAMLEALVARQFVERASAAQVRELRAAFDELDGVVTRRPDDIRAILDAKNRLYRTLFDGADNSTVRSILASLTARISALRASSLGQPGRTRQALDEVRAIVEAVEARDADTAAHASSRHVERAARTILTSLTATASAGARADRDAA